MLSARTFFSISGDRRLQFAALLKRAGVVTVVVISFVLFFLPIELKYSALSVNLSLLTLAFVLRTVYIFLSSHHQQQFNSLRKKITETYHTLAIEQKLYINAMLMMLFTVFIYILGGRSLGIPAFVTLLLFLGFIAFRDVLRWYRSLSENPYGKAAIAIGFAISSNLAYALANQLVTQITNVTPTNFSHTTLFIAVLMIPVLMTFAGGFAFAIGSAASSLVIIFSMGQGFDKFRQWLFAGTWPIQTLKFAFATRLFQLVFYLSIMSAIYVLGGKNFAWYEKKLSGWIPSLVYNLDMYAASECKLGNDFKIAPLGDAKFLIAHKTASGISFQLPAKCDDLLPAKTT